MLRIIFPFLLFLIGILSANAQLRRWTTVNGLPTDEVRQIVELPNGQMLVGCNGQYCLTLGETFVPVRCDRKGTVKLRRFSSRYGHLWQGDSLLWLHDLYRLYLFDARKRTFLNVSGEKEPFLHDFIEGNSGVDEVADELMPLIDSLRLGAQCTTAIRDRQGGLWIGTREAGITYLPPMRVLPLTMHNDTLMYQVRDVLNSKRQLPALPYRRINLICDLPDNRVLIGHDLNMLSYFLPEGGIFVPIENHRLSDYRNMVGALPLNRQWTLVYTQNGIFMLDTQSDTLAAFPPAKDIEAFTDKYNCILYDKDVTLWVGTQNGLFRIENLNLSNPQLPGPKTLKVARVEGLANNCIRSLVLDAEGHVWAGTSCGVSRITPSVVNLGSPDGIPNVSMMERSAMLTADSMLVFVHDSRCTLFRPEWVLTDGSSLPVHILGVGVNGRDTTFRADLPLSLLCNENYLRFQFSTLDYAHPSHSRYRYRLNGLEGDWHETEQTHGYAEVSYSALPPGDYTFEVQAASDDGWWGESAMLSVSIAPPFWLAWWAKSFYLLLLLTATAILISLYLKKKRAKLERENDAKVNQLFELREEARHQFAENTSIDPTKIGINSDEEALVTTLLCAIEVHLSDSDYGVDQLASDVAMSRSKLYDKMRNMLGISPADFVRNVRLKRAAQMLADSSLSISEISDRVGFGTARNFSTQFKKMFGVLPSEYRAPSVQT